MQEQIAAAVEQAFAAAGDLIGVLLIRRATDGEYDPAVGVPDRTEIDYQVRGFVGKDRAKPGESDEEKKDLTVYVKPEGSFEPQYGDDLVMDGVARKILSVERLRPASRTFLFKLEVER